MKRPRPLPPPSSLSIRHSCTEYTPEQSLIYLTEICVAQYKSQVARDFCSQTDHLTPPKGVSTIPSQAITVHLSALGSLPSTSALSGRVSDTCVHHSSHSRLGSGVWGWECATSLGSGQRALVCESRAPVPTTSELGDLRHVTATSEPQFPICNIRRLQATDPPRLSSPPEGAAPLRRAGARRRWPRPLPLL